MAYCFARLDEEASMFENKNLCLKMADLLLYNGAEIDTTINPSDGLTLLMQFCGIETELDNFQQDVNLEIVEFLLEHGADKNLKNMQELTAWDLSNRNPQKKKIQKLLIETKQKYVYSVEKTAITSKQSSLTDPKKKPLVIEYDGSITKCGCFSW